MKIYTKTGDQGSTALWGGSRVSKNNLRVEAYGTLDELNSSLGVALSFFSTEYIDAISRLLKIQGELFQLGAEVATQPGYPISFQVIHSSSISRLELEIDQMETELSPLKTFILPGGARAGAQLHVARTVSRRAERCLVGLHETSPLRPEVMMYLNRLSDYLFVFARWINARQGVPESPWYSDVVEKS